MHSPCTRMFNDVARLADYRKVIQHTVNRKFDFDFNMILLQQGSLEFEFLPIVCSFNHMDKKQLEAIPFYYPIVQTILQTICFH